MSQFELAKTRMMNGVWEGVLSRVEPGDSAPEIVVMHKDVQVPDVKIIPDDKTQTWAVFVPIPSYAVADGVHSFVIFDTASDDRLAQFTLMSGDELADDIRAEMELLRAELDMLKRAFRRHCIETT